MQQARPALALLLAAARRRRRRAVSFETKGAMSAPFCLALHALDENRRQRICTMGWEREPRRAHETARVAKKGRADPLSLAANSITLALPLFSPLSQPWTSSMPACAPRE